MAEEIAMIFEHLTAGVVVKLTEQAIAIINRQALDSKLNETGGILIGRYQDDGNTAVVTGATARTVDSSSGRAWFSRGVTGLKELLRERWQHGEYYLGEWHSHPGGSPDPSGNDFREMRSISLDSRYRCTRPLLIVAGTSAGAIELSVSVIDSGRLERLLVSPTSTCSQC
ncbi:MAG: Mov34/MPN/PAD-1 family protein [Alphaproteobacteria bacterium]|nr:Mov34/MPN/PAD-1 family protein [Alphaproteobacteria bacterium]